MSSHRAAPRPISPSLPLPENTQKAARPFATARAARSRSDGCWAAASGAAPTAPATKQWRTVGLGPPPAELEAMCALRRPAARSFSNRRAAFLWGGRGIRPGCGRFSLPDGTPVLVLPGCPEHRAASRAVVPSRNSSPLRGHRQASAGAGWCLNGNLQGTCFSTTAVGAVGTRSAPRAGTAGCPLRSAEFPYLARRSRAATNVPLGARQRHSVGMLPSLLAATEGGRTASRPSSRRRGQERLVAQGSRQPPEEGLQPQFHTRMSDRTAALLNHAVSRETSPSPRAVPTPRRTPEPVDRIRRSFTPQ